MDALHILAVEGEALATTSQTNRARPRSGLAAAYAAAAASVAAAYQRRACQRAKSALAVLAVVVLAVVVLVIVYSLGHVARTVHRVGCTVRGTRAPTAY